ncbi:TPA: DUF1372 family protein [Streptococcus suis]|uniref:DUF1372 family protein n=6 Tax=Streptococcus suis TaxID=1307 RepID=A0A0Z8BCJ0_STRSU|nr:DUF1372 family protein [Streptococcus suis]ANM47343.1 hypothetical protein [Streptococcus phage phiZJ20091101-1]QBX21557.1 hypothetical protein Javan579_0021 [Streptococcus phage Javan579]AEB80916.1 protein of unknown function DUF1372 [Streptococcus suis ST3]AGW86816.1 hypothetical protein YB51_2220 [Streptococcus suis YB51]AHF60228.1 Phage protein [Streptococcus suis 05HAS68]
MKEIDPLVLVTLCIVIALFAAVTEVKVLREQVKRLEEREMVIIHKVDNAGVTMVGKVTRKDIIDGRYYVEIGAYGKFLVTKGQFETINIGDDIPDYLQGRGS